MTAPPHTHTNRIHVMTGKHEDETAVWICAPTLDQAWCRRIVRIDGHEEAEKELEHIITEAKEALEKLRTT